MLKHFSCARMSLKKIILLLVELENKISCSYCGGVRIRLKFLGFDFKYIFFLFLQRLGGASTIDMVLQKFFIPSH